MRCIPDSDESMTANVHKDPKAPIVFELHIGYFFPSHKDTLASHFNVTLTDKGNCA